MIAGDRPDIHEVSARLRDRTCDLAEHLFPLGRRFGRQWVVGGLDGEVGQSLRIDLVGDRRGLWVDHAASPGTPERGGDMLSLVAQVMCAGDVGRAITWAADWLRIGPRSEPARPVPPRVADNPKTREDARQRAKGHWLSGRPIAGTMAEDYLRGRGIDLRILGRHPGALRFHPEVKIRLQAGEGPPQERYYPAMVAAVQGADGSFVSCHRTLLARRADGAVGKADLPYGEKAKRIYYGTSLQGGYIPLWRGASGKPMRQAPDGDRLAIAEGIENALTVALADPSLRVVASVTVGNMALLTLPPAIREVLICADNDPELDRTGRPHPARVAIERAVARFQGEGRRVLLAYASGCKDFNDRLIKGAA